MKIGVKYCGGCNPSYDRRREVEQLARILGENCLEPIKEGTEYDQLLLVCGCQRACIRNYRDDKERTDQRILKYHVVKSREDFQAIARILYT